MTRSLSPLLLALSMLCLFGSQIAVAQSAAPPYEERLLRLSEIVGSVHYIRTLCSGTDEGWRDMMQSLIDLETTDAAQKTRLTAAFNRGYRSFAAVHAKCNDVALQAEEQYRKEGLELASAIIARYGN
jgi:uncharacterized protein (TIGR02301 family)